MSKCSALSINVLFIFEMQEVNGSLFLKANYLSYIILPSLVTVIFPFTTIFASEQSHKFDLSINVLNLICLLGYIYHQYYLTDHELLSIF